jgi:hypothetical protein
LINNNAYIELLSKKIVYESAEETIETLEKIEEQNKKILRHEVIHAFFHESGLRNYARDEVLTDWLALQFGKIKDVFDKLGINESPSEDK